MKRQLDVGIGKLKERLITMAGQVEVSINYSIEAWKSRNPLLIDEVNRAEALVNQANKDVDPLCLKILATQQPMAFDLRLVLSIVKINVDLERMMDQAVNIVRNTEFYLRHPTPWNISELTLMSEEVRFMVREAIDAFVRNDGILASNVLRCDDKVDNYKDQIFYDTTQRMKAQPSDIDQGLAIILIARNLERIGDHATNIAEDVVFTVTGQDIRHGEKSRFQEENR